MRIPSPREGVILRSPAFPPSSSYKSPLLSHHLHLNKSSPSWPHPPAAASLPRGPEAPTTQAGQGGGPTRLPVGEAAHGEHVHTQYRFLPTHSLTHCSETYPWAVHHVSAHPSCRHSTCACPNKTRMHAAPTVPSTRVHSTDHHPCAVRGAPMCHKPGTQHKQSRVHTCAQGTPNTPEHTSTTPEHKSTCIVHLLFQLMF